MSKLIVLSADAMVGEDLALLKQLPNYRKYLAGGAEITNVTSIYPTVTYPAHTTMCTGNFPNKHGVTSNFVLQPGANPLPWNWFHDAVQCRDLFDAAKEQGYSTAAVFWPVTGKHPSIDYLVDEYWGDASAYDVFQQSGSSPEVLEIVKRHAHLIEGKFRKHPPMEDFAIACACDILRQFKPDVLLIHPANIDGYRHENGLWGAAVDAGIYETDRFIGMLAEAAIAAGTWDETDFFLVSDHGQLDIKRSIKLNPLLADAGLLTTDECGKLVDWQAYSLSNGMSAVIYLKDPSNQTLHERVAAVLHHLCEEGVYGIQEVLTTAEANEREQLNGTFSFVVESDGYTSFSDDLTRPLVRSMNNSDYRYGAATHGYLPHKGPQPILLAKGPHIREGVVLNGSHIVHEAPTYAKILGLSLGETDGAPILEILK